MSHTKWSNMRILALNSAMASVQLGFCILGLLVNPFLDGQLNFSPTTLTLINMIGPLGGFFVQPIVGAWSDITRSRFGRRRPFIVAGSLLSGFSYLFFIGAALLGPGHAATALAVIGMLAMVVGLNTTLAPYRALSQEVIPIEDRDRGNSFASVVLGIVFALINFVFFGVCYAVYGSDMPENLSGTPEFRTMFMIAAGSGTVLSILFIFPVCIVAKETSVIPAHASLFHEEDGEEGQSGSSDSGVPVPADPAAAAADEGPAAQLRAIGRAFMHMPRPMIMLLCALLFANAGFFPYQMFLTTDDCLGAFIGSVITGITCIASFGFSFTLPRLMKRSTKMVWVATQLAVIPAFALFVAFPSIGDIHDIGPFFHKHWFVVLCALAVGLNQASMNAVPFAMIGKGIAGGIPNGTACSMLNMALVVGQGIALLVMMALQKALGSFRTPFVVCLIFGSISAATVGFINTKKCDTFSPLPDHDEEP